jgi:hypothetical protein
MDFVGDMLWSSASCSGYSVFGLSKFGSIIITDSTWLVLAGKLGSEI